MGQTPTPPIIKLALALFNIIMKKTILTTMVAMGFSGAAYAQTAVFQTITSFVDVTAPGTDHTFGNGVAYIIAVSGGLGYSTASGPTITINNGVVGNFGETTVSIGGMSVHTALSTTALAIEIIPIIRSNEKVA